MPNDYKRKTIDVSKYSHIVNVNGNHFPLKQKTNEPAVKDEQIKNNNEVYYLYIDKDKLANLIPVVKLPKYL